jgi:potassium-dependent mechanosensitive channel
MTQAVQPIREFFSVEFFQLGSRSVTLATLLAAMAIVVGSFVLSRVLRAGIRRVAVARGLRPTGGVAVVNRLLHYFIVLVGLSVALQTTGIELGTLFAAGAIFAVGIGFAMQNIAQNFMSGVILLIDQAIKPGDILQVEGQMVRVREMGIRSTLVRTLDEEDMIVPNSLLVQSTVKNYTHGDPHCRLRVSVGVSYESDMKKVRETLLEVGRSLAWRATAFEPLVLMNDFGTSSVDHELVVWTDEPWRSRVLKSAMRMAIWDAFQREKITISFPQVDVHFDAPVTESLGRLARAA